MVDFDTKQILEDADKDYEKTWIHTAELLSKTGVKFKLPDNPGTPNPTNETLQRFRSILLQIGFQEVILPSIVQESEIYKQYGPEAPIILDRVFYLAGLPRPEIGLSAAKLSEIQKIIPNFNREEQLQNILRQYKKSQIESDDLIEEMVNRLKIRPEEASLILNKVFPEFQELVPIPSRNTLRSHMTAQWFPVLAALSRKTSPPILLFTTGTKYRREQQLDATHLLTSYTVSLVVYDEEITLIDGQKIATRILTDMGYPNVKFQIKRAPGKYYAPGMEFEIFIKHPKTQQWIEIGDGGLYSPIPLAKYGIRHPVFNLGFGVERFAMITTGEEDIRALTYPYFYKTPDFTDDELAKMIHVALEPQTKEGQEIAEAIIQAGRTHKDLSSPVDLIVWRGQVKGVDIEVHLWEQDKDTKLLGPAAMNKIIVQNQNITGLPDTYSSLGGVDTGLTYLSAVASEAAARIEKLAEQPEEETVVRVKMAKQASDINLTIDDLARIFITSKQKKIDLRGPVFIGVTGRKTHS